MKIENDNIQLTNPEIYKYTREEDSKPKIIKSDSRVYKVRKKYII